MEDKLDWGKFEGGGLERIRLDTNIPVTLGFASLKMIDIDVTDSTTKQLKSIPALRLTVDSKNNAEFEGSLTVTSKRFAKQIQPAYENGDLFKKLWKITKTGSGFQTNYTMIVQGDKVVASALTSTQLDGK